MYKSKRLISLILIITGLLHSLAVAQSKHSISNKTFRLKTTPSVFDDPKLVKQYQQVISPEDLSARLYFLASDYFEGRGTGTRGQRMAAQYLASQYRQMGLMPKGSQRTTDSSTLSAYLQPFSLYRLTPQETRLEVSSGGSKIAESIFSAETHDDLSFYSSGGAADESGGVVFIGYGIGDDKLGYNDYAALRDKGISIDGKWVIMLADEPLADAATSLLPTPEHKISRWTTGFTDKRTARWKTGAHPKGILVVNELSLLNKSSFPEMAAMAQRNTKRQGTLSYYNQTEVTQTYTISAKFADQILASSGQKIEELKQQIDKSLQPAVFELKNVNISSKIRQSPKLDTENVLAFIEGSDPKLKDEVLVISAHYDHLGINPLLTGDQIFNGAADDGSGTVAVQALAQAFMKAKRDGYGPRRSILFANFTGEEAGHQGSFYYTNVDPLIPFEKTVANINMDGVGGIDLKNPTGNHNYVFITGMKDLSDELLELNKRITSVTGSTLSLADGSQQGFSSDDRDFRDQLIPYIYYSTGRTEHYHTVRDEPQTIDYEHMTRVIQLVFANAWQVANQEQRPSRVDRSQLKIDGYICPPCDLECDLETKNKPFSEPGVCPICGMNLVPNYVRKS